MKQTIIKYTNPETGNLQTGIIDPVNANFDEVFDKMVNYGVGLQRFIRKLHNHNNNKANTTIRISLIGDSIADGWTNINYDYTPALYFADRYPNLTFEFRNILWGGTGSDYIISGCLEIANYNPDLIIYMEGESYKQNEMNETSIRLLKEKTSADIAIIPWSLGGADMDYFTNHDISGYKAGAGYIGRKWYFAMRSKYNLGFIDVHKPMMKALWDGTETRASLSVDGVHLTEQAYSYFWDALDLCFAENYENEHICYETSDIQNNKYFGDVIKLPDVIDIAKSGVWSLVDVTTDKTYYVARSSEVGAHLSTKINGIGFELSYYGGHVGVIGIEVDGVNASNLIKDYLICGGQVLTKLSHVIVNTNVLSNDDTEAVPYISFTSATEYNVKNASHQTIASGNINTDLTFDYLAGNLTIPTQYGGISNFRGTYANGSYLQLYVRKNWYNSITVAADSLTHTIRIFGLERGEHTVKLICNSGTISLDSILELK